MRPAWLHEPENRVARARVASKGKGLQHPPGKDKLRAETEKHVMSVRNGDDVKGAYWWCLYLCECV